MKLSSKEIRKKINHTDISVVDMIFSSDSGDRQIKVTAIASREYVSDGGFSGNFFVEKKNDWIRRLILELESSDETKFGNNTNYKYFSNMEMELFKNQVEKSGIR